MYSSALKSANSSLNISKMNRQLGDAMTDKYEQYIRHGQACVEIAKGAVDQAERVMLMHIAETWLRLADAETEKRTLH
jgi:hypothetical protein